MTMRPFTKPLNSVTVTLVILLFTILWREASGVPYQKKTVDGTIYTDTEWDPLTEGFVPYVEQGFPAGKEWYDRQWKMKGKLGTL